MTEPKTKRTIRIKSLGFLKGSPKEQPTTKPASAGPVVKASLKNIGKGILEFTDNGVKFHLEKGGFKKSVETIREIPLTEISGLRQNATEFRIEWGGVSDTFIMEDAESAKTVHGRVNAAWEKQQASPAPEITEQTIRETIEPAAPSETPNETLNKKTGEPSNVAIDQTSVQVQGQEQVPPQTPLQTEESVQAQTPEQPQPLVPILIEPQIQLEPEVTSELKPEVAVEVKMETTTIAEAQIPSQEAALVLEIEQDQSRLREQMRNELARLLAASLETIDALFDMLIGLHGRVNWRHMDGCLQRYKESGNQLASLKLGPTNLKFTKLSKAIATRRPDEISKETFDLLKQLHEYFNGSVLGSELQAQAPIHPNHQDAKIMVLAYYTLNDIALGLTVGDEELGKERSIFMTTLNDLSKNANVQINDVAFIDVLNKMDKSKDQEKELGSTIAEGRALFRQQLNELVTAINN